MHVHVARASVFAIEQLCEEERGMAGTQHPCQAHGSAVDAVDTRAGQEDTSTDHVIKEILWGRSFYANPKHDIVVIQRYDVRVGDGRSASSWR
jgi:hypothetical protein